MSKGLQDWWSSPLGSQLLQQEQRVVAESLDDVFGFQLLQIGAWGRAGDFFTAARTQRKAVIATSASSPTVDATPAAESAGNDGTTVAQIYSRPSELGVASDSVDAVLLPHTLEFESDPYAVLREVARILVGEGKLIILGFNPFSPWALHHHLSRQGLPPGLARLISEHRLRDWLALLSFEVTATRPYFFQLPWPIPASAYLLKANKRVYTLTPKRARRREKRSLVGGLVEPTTRNVESTARNQHP